MSCSLDCVVAKTLRERTQDFSGLAFDGTKNCNVVGKKQTGRGFRYPNVKYLACVDIDLDHKSGESIDDIVERLIPNLESFLTTTCIERTASLGFHIYCNLVNDDELYIFKEHSRRTKILSAPGFDIDLFGYNGNDQEKSWILFDKSTCSASITKHGKENSYVWLNESGIDGTINVSLTEVLAAIGFDIQELKRLIDIRDGKSKAKTDDDVEINVDRLINKPIASEKTFVTYSNDILELVIAGFNEDCNEIHNDCCDQKMPERLALYNLFTAANSLPDEYKERLITQLRTKANLSDDARKNFDSRLKQYSNKTITTSNAKDMLINALKWHNKSYYENIIEPALADSDSDDNYFDRSDKFLNELLNVQFQSITYKEFLANVSYGKYNHINDLVRDMFKCFRTTSGSAQTCYVYNYDSNYHRNMVTIEKLANYKQRFREIKTRLKAGKKTIRLIDVYVNYLVEFEIEDTYFKVTRSTKLRGNHKYIELFTGYYFSNDCPDMKDEDKVDASDIQTLTQIVEPLLTHLRELFNDDGYFDWFIKWIAFIMQYPGEKTKVVPCLYGIEGTGKSIIVDYLLRLLVGYSTQVDNVEQLCGKFTSIAAYQMLVGVGEAEKYTDGKLDFSANSKFKRLITDMNQVLEKKGIDAITIDSIINIIITTNYLPYGLFSGPNDRRIAPIKVTNYWLDAERKTQHFNELWRLLDDDHFLIALTHYFLSIDLSGYDVSVIPQTAIRYELIAKRLFGSPDKKNSTMHVIVNLYHELYSGMLVKDVEDILKRNNHNSTESLSVHFGNFKKILNDFVELEKDGNYKRVTKEWCDSRGVSYDHNNRLRYIKLTKAASKTLLQYRKMALELGYVIPDDNDLEFDELQDTIAEVQDIVEDPVEEQIDVIAEAVKNNIERLKVGIPTSDFLVDGKTRKEINEYMKQICLLDARGFKRKTINGKQVSCYVLKE